MNSRISPLALCVVALLALPRTLALPATTAPSTRPAIHIVVDTSEVPDLDDFGTRVQTLADLWYPKLIELLPSDGFAAPTDVTITFRKNMRGVAGTSGNRIACAANYFRKHPDDLGAIVHEMAHVVQSYHHRVPGWLTEGIADYVRFYRYEPAKSRPHPNPDRAKYDDSYRTTASFLNFAAQTCDPDLVIKLNAACRQGKYTPSWWQEHTGRTLESLANAWKVSLGPTTRPTTRSTTGPTSPVTRT